MTTSNTAEHNTVTSFAKRQEARDFAKSVNGKVIDNKGIAGGLRWDVQYYTTPAVQEVQDAPRVILQLREVHRAKREQASSTATLKHIKAEPGTIGDTAVNLKGKVIPITHKRSHAYLM